MASSRRWRGLSEDSNEYLLTQAGRQSLEERIKQAPLLNLRRQQEIDELLAVIARV